jgi:hypothetical protein
VTSSRARCRGRRLAAAGRGDLDAIGAPTFVKRHALRQPRGERADGRYRHDLALQIGNLLNRRIFFDHDADIGGRTEIGSDGAHRRAFGRKCHARSAAEPEIDRVGGKTLLQLGITGEIDDLHIEPVFGEDALADADIERREGEGGRHRLADADFLRGIGGTRR